MYNYDNYYGNSLLDSISTQVSGSIVWTIIAAIVAVVGGFLVYFLFLKQDVKLDNKFLIWFKNFLNFKEMLIEPILKVTYLILAIYITLSSFNLIGTSFVAFLLTLILGNVMLRVIYEASLIIVMIWRNTSDINKKIK